MQGSRAEIGEHGPGIVTVLLAQSVVIDAASVYARRCAGLQASDAQRQFSQPRRQTIRGRIAGPAAGMIFHADVDLSAEERAYGQHHAACANFDAALGAATDHSVSLQDKIGHLLLKNLQVRLSLEHAADGALVQPAIGLRASGAHGGTLARIQGAQLNGGLIRGERHRAPQRVYLLDQMPLADATDRRIAAHLPQRLYIVCDQKGAGTHARRRERRLGAGMAAADHNHVVFRLETHRPDSTRFSARRVL